MRLIFLRILYNALMNFSVIMSAYAALLGAHLDSFLWALSFVLFLLGAQMIKYAQRLVKEPKK